MKDSTGTPAVTVGLDVGDRTSQLCRLDSDGQVVEETRIRTTKTPSAVASRRWPPAEWCWRSGPTLPGSADF